MPLSPAAAAGLQLLQHACIHSARRLHCELPPPSRRSSRPSPKAAATLPAPRGPSRHRSQQALSASAPAELSKVDALGGVLVVLLQQVARVPLADGQPQRLQRGLRVQCGAGEQRGGMTAPRGQKARQACCWNWQVLRDPNSACLDLVQLQPAVSVGIQRVEERAQVVQRGAGRRRRAAAAARRGCCWDGARSLSRCLSTLLRARIGPLAARSATGDWRHARRWQECRGCRRLF